MVLYKFEFHLPLVKITVNWCIWDICGSMIKIVRKVWQYCGNYWSLGIALLFHVLCGHGNLFTVCQTAREKVVGWYHTGPKLHHNDIAINELIRKYCPNSVSWSAGILWLFCLHLNQIVVVCAYVLNMSVSLLWSCYSSFCVELWKSFDLLFLCFCFLSVAWCLISMIICNLF